MEDKIFKLSCPSESAWGARTVVIHEEEDSWRWYMQTATGALSGVAFWREVEYISAEDGSTVTEEVVVLSAEGLREFGLSNTPSTLTALPLVGAADDDVLVFVAGSPEVRRGSDGEVVGIVPTGDER